MLFENIDFNLPFQVKSYILRNQNVAFIFFYAVLQEQPKLKIASKDRAPYNQTPAKLNATPTTAEQRIHTIG